MGKAGLGGDAVTELDEIGASLDAVDGGLVRPEGGRGEGEEAFAAAHVGDAAGGARFEVGGGGEVGEEFGEVLDLAELGGLIGAGEALGVGDAEGLEPGSSGVDEAGFDAVVLIVVGGGGGGCLLEFDVRAAVGAGFELDGLRGGEEVGVEESNAQVGGEGGDGFGGREIFGGIAGGVAPDEGKLRAGFKRDGAHEDVAQGGLGIGGFAEGEFYEGVVAEGGGGGGEKTITGGGLRHSPRE